MGETKQLANQVCLNCKARKRKCSKELPSCQLCSKLLIACNYQYGNFNTTGPGAAQSHPPSPAISTAENPFINVFPGTTGTHPSSNRGPTTLSEKILDHLIDAGESIPSVTAIYFRTIDIWLPIVSRERILEDLDRSGNHLSNELAILLFCMYLITRVPGTDDRGTMKSALYLEVKSLYSVQTSTGDSSMGLVQAGLLICIYEHGHGLFENAQMTMAGVSRLGMRILSTYIKLGEQDVQNTEVGHLWWGIVIMDRFMNLGVDPGDIHLEMGLQGVNSLPLPYDHETAVQVHNPGHSIKTPAGISAGTQPTRLGPFCRTAEAAQRLGAVLEFVSLTCSNLNGDEFQKAHQLDQALQQLAMALMQQATNGWEECCASIGICFSALLTLHSRIRDILPTLVIDDGVTIGQENLMAIKASTRILIDISRRFHMDRPYIDLPALPLPSTYSIYQAALLHIEFGGKDFASEKWTDDMENLKSSLRHFSRRWDVGRRYLAAIDIAIEAETKRRHPNVDAHG